MFETVVRALRFFPNFWLYLWELTLHNLRKQNTKFIVEIFQKIENFPNQKIKLSTNMILKCSTELCDYYIVAKKIHYGKIILDIYEPKINFQIKTYWCDYRKQPKIESMNIYFWKTNIFRLLERKTGTYVSRKYECFEKMLTRPRASAKNRFHETLKIYLK